MRLVSFEKDGHPAPGLHIGSAVIDLVAAHPGLAHDWPGILAAGRLEEIRAFADDAPVDVRLPVDEVRLSAPIADPPKILCVGLNYGAHAEEAGMPVPEHPIFFIRFASSVVGSNRALVCPKASTQFDYEAEMAVVIGKAARHVSRAAALDHVAGYAPFNDGSVRDYQLTRGPQWTLGKNFDASGGFGPEIVTADELPPGGKGLRIVGRLNGEVVQEGTTDDLIFDVAELIHRASEVMTLEPGTVIATGTPPGVGMARDPQLWMQPGDRFEVEIEGIGTLSNPVASEDAA
ncbi:MAG: fumarylacetoacetate hydrolase family protein [Rhodovibrionaceae bacterium]|nr:fumarylacetoacetate hydrolase family protein [Rhodovibrionaceae bacterium]